MGLAFAIDRKSNSSDSLEKAVGSRNARASSLSFAHGRKSIIATANNVNSRFKGLNSILKLFILYICLGLLASVGGIIFYLSEYDKEQAYLLELEKKWNNIEINFKNQTDLEYIIKYGKYKSKYHDSNKWEYRYSAFFASTIFTTCGFGLQAPITSLGRAMTFIYGLPAIILYGVISRKIGMLCFILIEKTTKCICKLSDESYKKHKIKIIMLFVLFFYICLSILIDQTATNDGFGNGMHDIRDALYFMWTTTATIGYGDVMMSGGHPLVSPIVGLWLASTLGMAICLLDSLISQRRNKIANKAELNLKSFQKEFESMQIPDSPVSDPDLPVDQAIEDSNEIS